MLTKKLVKEFNKKIKVYKLIKKFEDMVYQKKKVTCFLVLFVGRDLYCISGCPSFLPANERLRTPISRQTKLFWAVTTTIIILIDAPNMAAKLTCPHVRHHAPSNFKY